MFTFMLLIAFLIRFIGLYTAFARAGYYRIDKGGLVVLALFSTLLGFIMPAGGFFDIFGVIFRIALFAIIIMIFAKTEFMEGIGITITAAIVESLIIIVLMITPFSWIVAGMGPLTVP